MHLVNYYRALSLELLNGNEKHCSVFPHISLLGSISETRESDLRNYVVLNTHTVAQKVPTAPQ
jgi:hypothetical protein